jgi:hypothetical protein
VDMCFEIRQRGLSRCGPVVVYYYSTSYKAVGGGGREIVDDTCYEIRPSDEPRHLWNSLPCCCLFLPVQCLEKFLFITAGPEAISNFQGELASVVVYYCST